LQFISVPLERDEGEYVPDSHLMGPRSSRYLARHLTDLVEREYDLIHPPGPPPERTPPIAVYRRRDRDSRAP
jgi:hypothetical protein